MFLLQDLFYWNREAPTQICRILREIPNRLDLILRELFRLILQTLTFSANRTRLFGFTTIPSATMNRIHLNVTSFFDTDSSFWVCDNSATGHICNDKSLFSGELVPSIYIVGTATETSEPTLMGTVVLRLTDDKGDKHTFTLTHVNYMPKFSVNLLSTRVLSEQYTNEHGFDRQGTGISSVSIIKLYFGIMRNSTRLSRHILLVFRNVCLIQATLN